MFSYNKLFDLAQQHGPRKKSAKKAEQFELDENSNEVVIESLVSVGLPSLPLPRWIQVLQLIDSLIIFVVDLCMYV